MIPFPFQSGGLGLAGQDSGVRSQLDFGGADGSTVFTDQNPSIIWTPGGTAQIDTSLGDQRGLFDGAGAYISTPDHPVLQFGTGAFSIKFTVRFNSTAGYQTICSKGYYNDTPGGWLIQTGNGDGLFNFYLLNNPGTTDTLVVSDSGTISTGVDYAMEINRVGTTVSLIRDGVTKATATSALNISNTSDMSIGGGSNTGYNNFWFNGWIKNWLVR